MAQYDYEHNTAHAGFSNNICSPRGNGQNECPGWQSIQIDMTNTSYHARRVGLHHPLRAGVDSAELLPVMPALASAAPLPAISQP